MGGFAQLGERFVDGMLDIGTPEAPQDVLGIAAVPSRSAVAYLTI
jgi:hypothetical protein